MVCMSGMSLMHRAKGPMPLVRLECRAISLDNSFSNLPILRTVYQVCCAYICNTCVLVLVMHHDGMRISHIH